MVINHLEKLFVTSDAATIIKELEVCGNRIYLVYFCLKFLNFQVQHPAARILILASQTQDQEVGDGTNGVMMFGSALLENADELLRMVRYLII